MSTFAVPPGVRRIVAIGSESTGKTDLVEWLGRELVLPWSAEYAREYALARGGSAALRAADVDPIARGQLALEARAIAAAADRPEPLVLHDTDLLSTAVYATAYYGDAVLPRWLHEALAVRAPALYLLCDIDVAWHADPVRDDAADRAAMQRRFVDALEARGAAYVTIRGSEAVRRSLAREAIARLVAGADERD